MGLPALPSWDEAQASWLAALNSLGRILGWSQIDSLESFQWMPYEDGTLIPITGEWLRGASFSTFTEIPVLFPPDETETARLVDGWNFDAERLGLSQRWQHVDLAQRDSISSRRLHRNLSRFSPWRWYPCSDETADWPVVV